MTIRDQDAFRETVWRQLLDYIEMEELFFPFKIRRNISPDAHVILNEFISLLIERKMLVDFRRKSLSNRIALWIYRLRLRKMAERDEILEVYVKGPYWETGKTRSWSQLSGVLEGASAEVAH
jgi:hypothetical protein